MNTFIRWMRSYRKEWGDPLTGQTMESWETPLVTATLKEAVDTGCLTVFYSGN